ncbi:MAG: molybdopterin-dependent oxidoreductase [Pseudomonadota bacterium]
MSDTKQVHTFCRVCEPACGLLAEVKAGEITRLKPDKLHPVSKGFACHKGIAALDIHKDPDRLNYPQRRNGDTFERIEWDTAFKEIGEKTRAILEKYGPNAIASYIGNPTSFNTLAGAGAGMLLSQLGVQKSFGSGTQDCTNKFAAGEAVFGSSTIHPVPDIENTDYLLIFGANPQISHMSFVSIADPMQVLRDAAESGTKIHFINPRRIESAKSNIGDVILIKPDTDLYLMAAMLHAICASGRVDETVTAQHSRNLEQLWDFVAQYSAERVASVVGISADEIRQLAYEFADAPSAAVHMSTGVNMGRQGTLAYWLLQMLSFVTGNLDREGGNLYSLGFYPAARAGKASPDVEQTFFDTPHGSMRRIRGSLPANLMPEYIQDPDEPIRAMFVMCGNPILSVGGEAKLREAFSQLELLVVVDIYRNATGELADYALPATDMLERPDINITGLGLQYQPFVQYTDRVVEPTHERKEEWWIFARLCQAMGFQSVLDDGENPNMFGRAEHMLNYSELSVEKLREMPAQTAVLPRPQSGRFYEEYLQTTDKKVDCCPLFFQESGALERAENIFKELADEPDDQLKLISRRDNYMHNSWYQNVSKLKRNDSKTNPLLINPKDAEKRELADGDPIRISNMNGTLDTTIAYDETLREGVVAMVHGWGNKKTPGMRVAQQNPGVNANALLPSGPGSFEPLSNQAFMTGIPVQIEKNWR